MSYTLHVTRTIEGESGGYTDRWARHGTGVDWETSRDQHLASWKRWGIPYTQHGNTYVVTSVRDGITTTTQLTWEPA